MVSLTKYFCFFQYIANNRNSIGIMDNSDVESLFSVIPIEN